MLHAIRKLFSGMWLRTDHVTRQEANPRGEKRLEEHKAGWTVLRNGQPIAELAFVRMDPPLYMFLLTPVADQGEILEILGRSAFRPPDPKISFKNKKNPELTVEDQCFFTGVLPDGTLTLRDVRP